MAASVTAEVPTVTAFVTHERLGGRELSQDQARTGSRRGQHNSCVKGPAMEIEGVAHLLHMQCRQPVARGVAEFLARHPFTRV